MLYWAEINPDTKIVERVIVADDRGMVEAVTGATRPDGRPRVWAQTVLGSGTERYAGIGDHYDERRAEKFDPSTRPTPSVDPGDPGTGES